MITDFVSGRQIDIDALRRMERYAVETPEANFNMAYFFNECGTSGCLCGTFCMREFPDRCLTRLRCVLDAQNKVVQPINFVMELMNLTMAEAWFLFIGIDRIEGRFKWSQQSNWATELTKQQAIDRLRKFIAYKIRKSELLEDYENARRKEGEFGIVCKVSESVMQKQGEHANAV